MEGFVIGHEQTSQTKCIRHFDRGGSGINGDPRVVYVDSPGYEDTAGLEVDMATSVAYKRVAEVCSSLRFVVLISCAAFFESRYNHFLHHSTSRAALSRHPRRSLTSPAPLSH
eukprot:510080-Pyramimonas_sp.AAC.1